MSRTAGLFLFLFLGLVAIVAAVSSSSCTAASPYHLRKEHDSLYWLNDWQLPYPVYRFCTGDVDGDGNSEALVGVVKSTRFHPEKSRRLFVFHSVNSLPRPLWLGSRLTGALIDFRYCNGLIRTIERDGRGGYMVCDYGWGNFGPSFSRFLVKDTDSINAIKQFNL